MAGRRLRVVVVAEEAAGIQVLRGLLALPTPPEVVAVLMGREMKPELHGIPSRG